MFSLVAVLEIPDFTNFDGNTQETEYLFKHSTPKRKILVKFWSKRSNLQSPVKQEFQFWAELKILAWFGTTGQSKN